MCRFREPPLHSIYHSNSTSLISPILVTSTPITLKLQQLLIWFCPNHAVISRTVHKWNHSVCKLLRLTFFLSVYFCWEPSKLLYIGFPLLFTRLPHILSGDSMAQLRLLLQISGSLNQSLLSLMTSLGMYLFLSFFNLLAKFGVLQLIDGGHGVHAGCLMRGKVVFRVSLHPCNARWPTSSNNRFPPRLGIRLLLLHLSVLTSATEESLLLSIHTIGPGAVA